jgi:hypothetical protein
MLIFCGFLRQKNSLPSAAIGVDWPTTVFVKAGGANVARLENYRHDHLNNSAKTPSAVRCYRMRSVAARH